MVIRKNYIKYALSLSIFLACSNYALADGNAFTPLNFDDTSYNAPLQPAATSTAPATGSVETTAVEKVGNDNIQNAILELDNAQVGIRNELLNCKAKYAEVDAQYKLIKNERSALNKQVKATEKRIKDIDKAKEKIRKNML